MAKDTDPLAGIFDTKDSGGLFSGLLAEENEFDRRVMWRLGSWGAAAVGAVVVAVMANQAQLGWRRDQLAAVELARQAQELHAAAKESQNEAKRLSSAVDTLNSDRDRLYARVTVLEQGLDSVTGAIAKQNAAAPTPAPLVAAKPQPDTSEPQAPAEPQAPSPQAVAPIVGPVASNPIAPTDKPRAEAAAPPAPAPQLTAVAAPSPAPAPAPAASGLPSIPPAASKPVAAPSEPSPAKLLQGEKAEKPKLDAAADPEPAAASPDDAPAKEPVSKEAVAKEAVAKDPAPNERPSKQAEAAEKEPPAISVQQTHFAVDLGSASSIGGLRALWRGLLKTNPDLGRLRPIIMLREGQTGLGMQLRLGAGPLVNAATAARICASLTESDHACETTVFDGQRLAMRGQGTPAAHAPPPAPASTSEAASPAPSSTKPAQHHRSHSKRSKREEPAPAPAEPPKPALSSTLSSFFSRR